MRSTLRAIWLLVPDPFFEARSNSPTCLYADFVPVGDAKSGVFTDNGERQWRYIP